MSGTQSRLFATLRLLAGVMIAGLAVLASPFAIATAGATTLSGTLTADNAFRAYLSTSASARGTLLTSGNNWGKSYNFSSAALTAGETYYLNIEVANLDGPAGFIGSFSLSGTGFHFANDAQTLNTGVPYWTGGFNAATSNLPHRWTRPTGSVAALGANGSGPWGPVSGVGSSAQWLWPTDARSSPGIPTASGGECLNCVVDFQTAISSIQTAPAPVPEPASLAIFSVAVGGLALVMRRRRCPA